MVLGSEIECLPSIPWNPFLILKKNKIKKHTILFSPRYKIFLKQVI